MACSRLSVSLACSRLRNKGEKSFRKKKCEKRAGTGERQGGSPIFPAATAPFPKSCASYFRFARFNTFPLYYLRVWHRLQLVWKGETKTKQTTKERAKGSRDLSLPSPRPFFLPLGFLSASEPERGRQNIRCQNLIHGAPCKEGNESYPSLPFGLRRRIQGKTEKSRKKTEKSRSRSRSLSSSYIVSSNLIKSFFQEARAFRPKDRLWQDTNNRHNQSYEHDSFDSLPCYSDSPKRQQGKPWCIQSRSCVF